jgi:predicted DNA-binding ribbon-helix-helix protein
LPRYHRYDCYKNPYIEAAPLKSIVKRSIVIDGHKTSISLEDAFWSGLKEIAHAQSATVSKIVAEIDKTRQQGNLSSAIRLFVLDQVRNGRDVEQVAKRGGSPLFLADEVID